MKGVQLEDSFEDENVLSVYLFENLRDHINWFNITNGKAQVRLSILKFQNSIFREKTAVRVGARVVWWMSGKG